MTCAVLSMFASEAASQASYALEEQIAQVADEIYDDSLKTPPKEHLIDLTNLRHRYPIDAGYRLPRVHPYFRDEYRIIRDLRRLIRFVDRNAIRGMESIPQMFEVVDHFPEEKQNELIETALLGSIANYASEVVSRQLRMKKMRFIQWELDRLVFRGSFYTINTKIYNGPYERGIRLDFPKYRIYYSHHVARYYINDSVTYWPISKIGFNYTRYDGRNMIGPRLRSSIGNFALSYDKDRDIILSGFHYRKGMKAIIRIVHVAHLQIQNADYLLTEVMFRW